jgi:hypothetical protein
MYFTDSPATTARTQSANLLEAVDVNHHSHYSPSDTLASRILQQILFNLL